MTIDYKALLERYVSHIIDCEGISFIDSINVRYASEVEFSDEEEAEMKSVADRVRLSRAA